MDESGVQTKGATSPSGNTKVMGKPPVPAGGGPQQVTSPNPIVQRLPAFLDNHNYAKSPMQVREASTTEGDKFKVPVCPDCQSQNLSVCHMESDNERQQSLTPGRKFFSQ